MTTKDMATRTGGAIEFTMMYVTHDAFRRDLGRFTAASAAGTAHSPGVREFSPTEGAARGTRGHLGPGARDQCGFAAGHHGARTWAAAWDPNDDDRR